MDRSEAVQKLATVGRLSIAHAEDLYDSIIPKPVVLQCIADWYEEIQEAFGYDLVEAINSIPTPTDGVELTDLKNGYSTTMNHSSPSSTCTSLAMRSRKSLDIRFELKGLMDTLPILIKIHTTKNGFLHQNTILKAIEPNTPAKN